MHSKIAFIKTGWSDYYEGGPVFGKHAHIQEFNEAHERFNFLRSSDGRYYGYTPPLGPQYRPPQPDDTEGWLLIFVAAKMGNGALTVVGWYENASFEKEYTERREYAENKPFPTDTHGEHYAYCFSTDTAYLIPTELRDTTVSGRHLGSTSIAYVKGVDRQEPWRQELASIAEDIVSRLKPALHETTTRIFVNQEHKDLVEAAAIEFTLHYFNKDYDIADKQKLNCGYDLLLRHKYTKEELHVEVKGTSSETMRFFISRNEYAYMSHPSWRLFIVTEALSSPKGKLLTRKQTEKLFDFLPMAWEATIK